MITCGDAMGRRTCGKEGGDKQSQQPISDRALTSQQEISKKTDQGQEISDHRPIVLFRKKTPPKQLSVHKFEEGLLFMYVEQTEQQRRQGNLRWI